MGPVAEIIRNFNIMKTILLYILLLAGLVATAATPLNLTITDASGHVIGYVKQRGKQVFYYDKSHKKVGVVKYTSKNIITVFDQSGRKVNSIKIVR